jgi:hypothetical protein
MHGANISVGLRLRIFHHPNKGLSVFDVMGPTQAPPEGQVVQAQSLGSVEVLLRYCSAVHSSAFFHF